MVNALKKSTRREIKNSFSRWFAILAIVALGVGFFCGLKVCREAFQLTGDEYLSKQNMYDYEFISTLGLDEDGVNYLKTLDGVEYVTGSYSSDIIYRYNDEELVAKLLTCDNEVNKPMLIEGKLPEKENEIAVDQNRFTMDDIGKTVVFAASNDKDTLDMFKKKEFTITGLVESPLYLNFERGSTSLGNGSVNCYMYLSKNAWDIDYYTEIYLTLKEKHMIFTDEYDDMIDENEDRFTDALDIIALNRYDEIKEEALDKLRDGEKELADGKKDLEDAKKKLRDAKKEISDGKIEIKENENKLNKSQKELDDSKKELAENEEKYSQLILAYGDNNPQAVAMRAGLDEAKIKIEDGQKEIDKGWKEIEKAKKELVDGEKKIADAEDEIKDGNKDIEKAEKEIKKAKKDIDDIKKPHTYLLTRNENIGYVCFDNDTNIVDGMAKIFPVFFLLVAALVVMTTMTRMVDEERTQIGILKALGYSKRKILGKYTTYSLSASLIGGVFGFFLGSYLFPFVIWKAYGMMYSFSDLIVVFNWKTGILSVLAALICTVGTTLFSCYRDLSEVPAQLIRPKAPALGKRILLERITFIWKRMSFLHKVSARNIFRYKKRFFMMVLGISGCTALLVTGMGINDSISNVVSQQYDEIYNIDYTVTFEDDLTESDREDFVLDSCDVSDDYMFVYSLSMDAHGKDITKATNVVVIEDNDGLSTSKDCLDGDNLLYRAMTFINIHTPKDRLNLKDLKGREEYVIGLDEATGQVPIPFPKKDECIVNSNLAVRLGLKLGDEISITDSNHNEVKCKIVGLCENFVYNYVYLSQSTWEQQMGDYSANSAFIIGKEGIDPNEGGANLANLDNVASVSITNEFKDRINNMMSAMDYVVALIIACAGALAFIVLYNLTNINITERIREIATIKVLGFYPKETAQYVFRENIILTSIAAVIGLPLGWLLNQYVMNQVIIDLLCFDVHVNPLSYVISIAVTFLFSTIVNIFMRMRLNMINMAESLKSIE